MSDLDELLRAFAADAPRAGIFCDFDGSLSEIVEDPEDASAVDGATKVLSQLSSRFAVVAVVSGRALASLEARIHPPGVRLVGLYGIEQSVDGAVVVAPEAEAARETIARTARRLEDACARIPGVHIEHKGLAVAVHFRRAEDPSAAESEAESIVRSIAAGERLTVVRGRRVLEVRPRISLDKGEAVRRMVVEHSLEAGLVAGDDVGDIPMFEAVGGMARAIRVVVDSDETPSALRDIADVRLGAPAKFVDLLKRLVELTDG